jgi:radical SAM protein with 4Fe4S-binding SPASM domain
VGVRKEPEDLKLRGSLVFVKKAGGFLRDRIATSFGRLIPLEPTLRAMVARPFELHLELTNLCNANCVFCPYQFQVRETQVMSDWVFEKTVRDYVACGGGSVGLTPIVGEALIDKDFVGRVRFLRAQPSVDRIWVTTNGILLDQHGIETVLECGLTSITISTSGFEKDSYVRIFRSNSYSRFKRNVYQLLEANSMREKPIQIAIALRTDRPMKDVLSDPDFKPVLKFSPIIDFTWSFTSANGRITRESLPAGMRLRKVTFRDEPCVQLYNGPIVLPDGTVMGCSCVAAVDAISDLGIGNVLEEDLLSIWTSNRMRELRSGFGTLKINDTCKGCDMYRDLSLYRRGEGRERARVNRARSRGELVQRRKPPRQAFSGG